MEGMERFFSLGGKAIFSVRKVCFVVFFVYLFTNTGMVNTQNVVNSSLLRFPVWFVIEEAPIVPTRVQEESSEFAVGVTGIRQLAPFFIEALVYGWEFSYTPSDQQRGVKEYFSIGPIVNLQDEDSNMRILQIVVGGQESRLESWVEYDLTERMIHERQRWVNASPVSVAGKGSASVFDGIESIEIACEIAAKNAIRAYVQSIEKNKPKEITGKIQLTEFPRYYIEAGKYVADLDFFLIVSTIEEYTLF